MDFFLILLGVLADFTSFISRVKAAGAIGMCATDLLALTVIDPPSKFGFEVAVGNSQRFGVPVGFGGPHAAFLAVSGKLKRIMPGRIIGWSVDTNGKPAVRMALQAREQHIKREKATSNICTAQVCHDKNFRFKDTRHLFMLFYYLILIFVGFIG